MSELELINQTARNYIILKASRKEVAEFVLNWWYNE